MLKPKLARVEEPKKEKQAPDHPLPPGVPKSAARLASDVINPTVVFESEGDYFIGRYSAVRTLTVNGKPRKLYDLTEGSTVVSVWGSAILDKRMATVPVGNMVSIMYTGETGEKKPGQNRPKDYVVDHWTPSERSE